MIDMQQIDALLAPTITGLGFELWGCEFATSGKRKVIRLYIDGPAGVGIDDCGRVSRQVDAVLAVDAPSLSDYGLEVSSPGLDRPLFKPVHYQRMQGAEIALMLRVPLEGQRRFKGKLLTSDEQTIELEVEGKVMQFALASISKANIVPNFDK